VYAERDAKHFVGSEAAPHVHLTCGADMLQQESRTIARKPRDIAAGHIGLKFADIHYKFKSSKGPKARLQSSRHTAAKQN